MAMENVAQEHITIEEEEAIVINWWTDGSNPMDPKIMDPLDRGIVPRMHSVTY
jgi:hypothetical protein